VTRIGMNPAILYISYTGLLDPLGQSQVLQYVAGLAPQYRMTLLTFEKPEALGDAVRLAALEHQCRAAGVDWHYLQYHQRPRLLATLYDVLMGASKGRALARGAAVQVVHCRSYLAALMGLLARTGTGARHLFDMRGFWVDERVDGGLWRRNSLQYRAFKYLERVLFTRTDHVVSLTHAGRVELGKFEYLASKPPPVTVIPTCTNLEIFRVIENGTRDGEHFTLGYVGSAGSWYLFDDVARVVNLLFAHNPAARFLVINKTGHNEIRATLLRHNVDLTRVEIKAVDYCDVTGEIARMDAGVFFIKPVWSKHASCPTRLGEFLASGKPVLTNGKVGDVEDDVKQTRTGVVINDMEQETLHQALLALLNIAAEPGVAQRCRKAAQDRFSLRIGIQRYSAIYTSLVADRARGTE
tara:strand:- start:5814 stop:7046 length:1233 start_codon:yes stop_codon:yes gene_type:complete